MSILDRLWLLMLDSTVQQGKLSWAMALLLMRQGTFSLSQLVSSRCCSELDVDLELAVLLELEAPSDRPLYRCRLEAFVSS